MPSVTREEYEQLQARRLRKAPREPQGGSFPVREGWGSGALVIFLPCKPAHGKSSIGTAKIWRTRLLRERTADRLLEHAGPGRRWPWPTAAPKLVLFTVYCRNPFDSDDNLRLVCSAPKDALKDMRLVVDDRDSARNVFVYTQVVTRKKGAVHGIAVRVELASARSEATPQESSAAAPVDGGG